MKKVIINLLLICFLLSALITKSQVSATLVCVDSVWYDSINPNIINVSVFNGDTINLNYPTVQIVSPITGDTISNVHNNLFYFAQLVNTFQTYTDTITVSGITDFSPYTFVMNHLLDSSTAIIQWCGNVGIEKYEADHILIFPNPVINLLSIRNLQNKRKNFISIQDITGKKIFVKLISEESEDIDVSYLPQGIYILEIYNESEKRVLSLVKE